MTEPDERPQQSFTWRDAARAYLNWRHDLLNTIGTERLADGLQSTLGEHP